MILCQQFIKKVRIWQKKATLWCPGSNKNTIHKNSLAEFTARFCKCNFENNQWIDNPALCESMLEVLLVQEELSTEDCYVKSKKHVTKRSSQEGMGYRKINTFRNASIMRVLQ